MLVDPNWTLIGQLPSSTHHPLGCCVQQWTLSVKQENGLVNIPVGHWRAEFYTYTYTYTTNQYTNLFFDSPVLLLLAWTTFSQLRG